MLSLFFWTVEEPPHGDGDLNLYRSTRRPI
nr:MAG TPA: hypothetical protein [Caudoviricetes sp.]